MDEAFTLQGGILPPVSSYWELKKMKKVLILNNILEESELLHNMKPIDTMTEEKSIEYLVMKDIPDYVWRDYETMNKPRLVICRKEQLPQKREWRNTWRIKEDINTNEKKVRRR